MNFSRVITFSVMTASAIASFSALATFTLSPPPTKSEVSLSARTLRPLSQSPVKPDQQLWDSYAGESLQALVASWSAQVGYQMVWDVPYDYKIEASFTLNGTFEQAITQLFNAFISSDQPMKVDIYQQQKLIHVAPL